MVQSDISRRWVSLTNGKETDWPQVATGKCFWDGEAFDGVPIFVPAAPIKKGGIVLDLTKEFCSFNCARSYLKESHKHNFIDGLILLARRHFGIFHHFNCAPPREAQDKYCCGYMDIATFRAKSITHECIISKPPMLVIPTQVEERITDPVCLEERRIATEKDRWVLPGIGVIPNFDYLQVNQPKGPNNDALPLPTMTDQIFEKKVRKARKSVKSQKQIEKHTGKGTLEYSMGLVIKKRKLN